MNGQVPDGPGTHGPATVDVRGVRVAYTGRSGRTVVFDGLDLHVPAGQNVAVVGPSGSGKSTLLRLVAGLMTPDEGRVEVAGAAVARPPAGLAVVFQDYARSLLGWLTAEQNVALPLGRGVSRRQRRERARAALADVGLADAARLHPWQLSGGMQQRVAIARALVGTPAVLLLDEPFAAVDAQTRGDLEDLLRRLWRERGMTVLLVTHDIDESVYVADRVVVVGGAAEGVVADVPVTLGDERDQLRTRSSQEFGRLRAEVLTAVQDAALRLRARADAPGASR